MIAPSRRSRITLLVALLGAFVALAASISRVDPVQAASYKSCVLTAAEAQPGGGKPTYNLTVKGRGVPCSTAKKVVPAEHRYLTVDERLSFCNSNRRPEVEVS